MKKDETVWLIIRLMGLASAVGAVYSAVEFTENVLAVHISGQPVAEGTLRLLNLRWDHAVNAVLLGVVSLYLLVRGKAMFALLMREGAASGRP